MVNSVIYDKNKAELWLYLYYDPTTLFAMHTTQTIGLYFKTKKEIALEYKLHPNTIATYFQRIGIYTRRRISPKLLEKFYQHYGRPE